MADNKISMPGSFGGLMRYDEESGSRFKISPAQVMWFIALVVVSLIFLKILMKVPAA